MWKGFIINCPRLGYREIKAGLSYHHVLIYDLCCSLRDQTSKRNSWMRFTVTRRWRTCLESSQDSRWVLSDYWGNTVMCDLLLLIACGKLGSTLVLVVSHGFSSPPFAQLKLLSGLGNIHFHQTSWPWFLKCERVRSFSCSSHLATGPLQHVKLKRF